MIIYCEYWQIQNHSDPVDMRGSHSTETDKTRLNLNYNFTSDKHVFSGTIKTPGQEVKSSTNRDRTCIRHHASSTHLVVAVVSFIIDAIAIINT